MASTRRRIAMRIIAPQQTPINMRRRHARVNRDGIQYCGDSPAPDSSGFVYSVAGGGEWVEPRYSMFLPPRWGRIQKGCCSCETSEPSPGPVLRPLVPVRMAKAARVPIPKLQPGRCCWPDLAGWASRRVAVLTASPMFPDRRSPRPRGNGMVSAGSGPVSFRRHRDRRPSPIAPVPAAICSGCGA